MRSNLILKWLALPVTAAVAGLVALQACGGGGESPRGQGLSVSAGVPGTPPVTPLPVGGGVTTPPGGGAGDGDALPPGGDGGTPGYTVPGPAPAPAVVASLAGVRALATDASAGVFFAVDEQGMLWRKQVDEDGAMPLYALGAFPVEGLTYAAQPNLLFLSAGGSHLATFDIDTLTLTVVGAFGPYTTVKGLEFDARAGQLYGVDAVSRKLLSIHIGTGAATVIGTLPEAYSQVEGLALDPVTERLYAADLASGRLLEINTATAAVAERTRLPRSTVAGLGYVTAGDRFLISDPGAGEIILWDAKGNDIDLFSVRGLDYDVQGRRVLGVHQGQSMLVEIDPVSGWKAWVGWIGVAGIESLAVDAVNRVAYGVDNVKKQLVRIALDNGQGMPVALLAGVAGSTSDIAGLAFDSGAQVLYGMDGTSAALVTINTATGATALLGTLPQPGVRSLAFEPGARLLHAYSSSTQMRMTVDPATFALQVHPLPGLGLVGGLAFDPQARVLWGTVEGVANLVPIWAAPSPATVGFDDVRSLAAVGSYLLGFDQATDSLVRIDPASGVGALVAAVGPFDIEALAFPAPGGQLLASDVRSGWLVRLDPASGTAAPVGALAYTDVRGLAFDNLGVLYGVDRATRSLVAIDPTTGACTLRADLGAHGLTDLQALAWDESTHRLLAVDAAQRRLVAIDPSDSSVQEIGLMDATDVRALEVEGPGVLLVLDRATDRLLRVNRFTGASLP